MLSYFENGKTIETLLEIFSTMRTSEDRSGPLLICTGNTGRSPVLTGELEPVDWHGLPVQRPVLPSSLY